MSKFIRKQIQEMSITEVANDIYKVVHQITPAPDFSIQYCRELGIRAFDLLYEYSSMLQEQKEHGQSVVDACDTTPD